MTRGWPYILIHRPFSSSNRFPFSVRVYLPVLREPSSCSSLNFFNRDRSLSALAVDITPSFSTTGLVMIPF